MNNPKSLTPTLTQSPQFQNTDAHILRFSLLRRVLLYSTVFFCSCRVILLALLRRVLLLAPSSALLRRVLLLASSSSLLRRIFLLAPSLAFLSLLALLCSLRVPPYLRFIVLVKFFSSPCFACRSSLISSNLPTFFC
ncbi:hypothetical protein AAHE18_03G275100 [Arachis hypogaea]